jgi:hypothetical protein
MPKPIMRSTLIDVLASDSNPLGDDWGGNLLRKFPFAPTPGGSGLPFRDGIEKNVAWPPDKNVLDPYWLHNRIPLDEAANTINRLRRVK